MTYGMPTPAPFSGLKLQHLCCEHHLRAPAFLSIRSGVSDYRPLNPIPEVVMPRATLILLVIVAAIITEFHFLEFPIHGLVLYLHPPMTYIYNILEYTCYHNYAKLWFVNNHQGLKGRQSNFDTENYDLSNLWTLNGFSLILCLSLPGSLSPNYAHHSSTAMNLPVVIGKHCQHLSQCDVKLSLPIEPNRAM